MGNEEENRYGPHGGGSHLVLSNYSISGFSKQEERLRQKSEQKRRHENDSRA
jgi:hypothetical protein